MAVRLQLAEDKWFLVSSYPSPRLHSKLKVSSSLRKWERSGRGLTFPTQSMRVACLLKSLVHRPHWSSRKMFEHHGANHAKCPEASWMPPTTSLSDCGGAVNLTRVFPKGAPDDSSNRTIMKGLTRLNYFNHNYCNFTRVLPSPLICRLPSISCTTCISVWFVCVTTAHFWLDFSSQRPMCGGDP